MDLPCECSDGGNKSKWQDISVYVFFFLVISLSSDFSPSVIMIPVPEPVGVGVGSGILRQPHQPSCKGRLLEVFWDGTAHFTNCSRLYGCIHLFTSMARPTGSGLGLAAADCLIPLAVRAPHSDRRRSGGGCPAIPISSTPATGAQVQKHPRDTARVRARADRCYHNHPSLWKREGKVLAGGLVAGCLSCLLSLD